MQTTITAYHGSSQQFDRFDFQAARRTSHPDDADLVFLTTDREEALGYTHYDAPAGQAGYLYTVQVTPRGETVDVGQGAGLAHDLGYGIVQCGDCGHADECQCHVEYFETFADLGVVLRHDEYGGIQLIVRDAELHILATEVIA